MDFFNRAMEQAKQLQQITADATKKSNEQATPLIQQGVKGARAAKTIIEQAPNLTAAAQEQANAALQHTSTFIAIEQDRARGRDEAAQQHLNIFADQAQKGRRRDVSAVQSATQKRRRRKLRPPDPPIVPSGRAARRVSAAGCGDGDGHAHEAVEVAVEQFARARRAGAQRVLGEQHAQPPRRLVVELVRRPAASGPSRCACSRRTNSSPPVIPLARLRPVGPRIATVPFVMYSQA